MPTIDASTRPILATLIDAAKPLTVGELCAALANHPGMHRARIEHALHKLVDNAAVEPARAGYQIAPLELDWIRQALSDEDSRRA